MHPCVVFLFPERWIPQMIPSSVCLSTVLKRECTHFFSTRLLLPLCLSSAGDCQNKQQFYFWGCLFLRSLPIISCNDRSCGALGGIILCVILALLCIY